jgi:rhodanese-related sulfurtransferase
MSTTNIQWDKAWRTPDGVPEVSTAWTAEHQGKLRFIDVREADELASPLSHIKGVEHVPMGDVPAAAASWDPTQPVVLICRSGGRSGRVAQYLERAGFARVVSMAGGMLRWNDEKRPTARQG